MDWLLDTTGFVTRDMCGPWDSRLKWTYIISNAVFALSYFGMPAMILALWVWRRRDMVYPWILLLFTAFIALCGLTHLFDVLVFWWPAYHLFTVVSAFGAIVSLATLCLLPIEIAFLSRVPTPKQWIEANEKLRTTVAAHEKTLVDLTSAYTAMERKAERLARMDSAVQWTNGWANKQKQAITELQHELKGILDAGKASLE